MTRTSRSVAALILAAACCDGSLPCRAAAAEPAIAASLPRLVKLHGAGGFKGLESYGTGFLASAEGHVVTSWGPLLDADPVIAVLDDGRRFDAALVGVDPALGLAVLKLAVDAGSVEHFDLSAAADAVPGDRVFALSNMFRVAAGNEPVSVMHGAILAKTPLAARQGRWEVSLEQPVYVIDAVTNNPGAAGGVVVSRDGRLVGMIGRELRSLGTETWINYAIPADLVRERFDTIVSGVTAPENDPKAEGPKVTRRPADLGFVTVPDVTARTPAYVTEILPGASAEAAGLKRDDLILFASGRPVRSIRELSLALSRAEPGDRLDLLVRRDGRLVPLTLQIP